MNKFNPGDRVRLVGRDGEFAHLAGETGLILGIPVYRNMLPGPGAVEADVESAWHYSMRLDHQDLAAGEIFLSEDLIESVD
jgi:hypothetical protein